MGKSEKINQSLCHIYIAQQGPSRTRWKCLLAFSQLESLMGSVILIKYRSPLDNSPAQTVHLVCHLVRKLDLLEFCLTSVFHLAVYCGSSSDSGMCSLSCSDGQMVLRYYLVVLPGLVLNSQGKLMTCLNLPGIIKATPHPNPLGVM